VKLWARVRCLVFFDSQCRVVKLGTFTFLLRGVTVVDDVMLLMNTGFPEIRQDMRETVVIMRLAYSFSLPNDLNVWVSGSQLPPFVLPSPPLHFLQTDALPSLLRSVLMRLQQRCGLLLPVYCSTAFILTLTWGGFPSRPLLYSIPLEVGSLPPLRSRLPIAARGLEERIGSRASRFGQSAAARRVFVRFRHTFAPF